jgi:hypothetical protein
VDIQKIARPPETGVEPAPLDIIAHFKCVNKLNRLFYYPRKEGYDSQRNTTKNNYMAIEKVVVGTPLTRGRVQK